MSAQPIEPGLEPSADQTTARPRLRLLLPAAPQVSNFGFLAIVGLLAAIGMGLVMVVSTSVTAQSKDLAALRKEATELGYHAAALTHELQQKSSTGSLALRAADLGMVPNPYPAFIQLSDGQILGTPKAVKGDEAPYLRRLPDPVPMVPTPEVVVGQTPAATAAPAPTTAAATTPAPDAAAQPVGQPAPTPTPTGGQP